MNEQYLGQDGIIKIAEQVATNLAYTWQELETIAKVNADNDDKITKDTIENKEQIKEVKKKYIKTYNNQNSVTISNDKLWLLSCSEIWDNGTQNNYGSGNYGFAI